MPQASKTFRIFVSSTFSDLKEERNALQRYVFPRLRELCLQHGCRFQAIDLRWGVSEEAGLDQQTMTICLDEIARCRRTSPRPNFIVLLGDRYGWRPLPPKIPVFEFEALCGWLSAGEQDRLKEWYLRDDNALPTEYCLKPRTGEYEDGAAWGGVERELMGILLKAVQGLPMEGYDRLKYGASATEQEIARGALLVPDAREHVFGFFRALQGLPGDLGPARDFVDLDAHLRLDQGAHDLLEDLKSRLRQSLPDNIHDYQATWTPGGPTIEHIGSLPETLGECLALGEEAGAPASLCQDVWKRLSRVLLEECSRIESVDSIDKEIADQQAFGAERARFFTGRGAILRGIGEYLGQQSAQPLVVYGASGSGKSALMARAAQQAREGFPDAQVVVRFIGATPGASDGRSLLTSLCQQLPTLYGAEAAALPSDYQELVQEFPKRLALATADQPLIVFLDALDQFSELDPARSLSWLPIDLPEHVHLVVSLLPDERKEMLARRLPATQLIEVQPMSLEEGGTLLDLWLQDANRTLQLPQREDVLGKFAQAGLPLYLKLAFDEARRWKSYEGLPGGADGIPGLSPTMEGMIDDLLWRLELPSAHGQVLVSRALGYLAAAKNGLTEDEILDVLSRDPEVLADFKRRSPRSPAVDRLPVVVWSRIYFDLEPYLTERAAEGATLLTFYHRQLAEAMAAHYLAGEARGTAHRALAGYFGEQALDFRQGDQATANVRKLVELPYQQTRGELWDALFATLTDFPFLERKAAAVGVIEQVDAQGQTTRSHTGVFQIQADYDLALQTFGGAEAQAQAARSRHPIIVTAVDFGQGLVLRCPSCLQLLPFQDEWLGQVINCPRSGCQGHMRVNPFVVGARRGNGGV